MVKPNCKGNVEIFRYADDAVICSETEADAIRIREALTKRLAKFKLQLNEEKTKLISFDKIKASQGIEQETFDFLGFTFYLGKSLRGKYVPKLKTKPKGMKTKLKRVTEWWKQNRNIQRLGVLWKIFVSKMRGHIQYFGVSHNIRHVDNFMRAATRIAFKWLNRRSQRKSFTWEQFNNYIERYPLPKVRVVHRLF
jgi:RNA-directed DNA polymerase